MVLVDADGDAFPAVFLRLIDIGGVGDFPLQKARFQRRNHPSDVVDAPEVIIAAGLQLIGHRLQKVAAAQRVDGVRYAGFVGDNLLRAEGLQRRLLRGQRPGLVLAVGVQRLAAAQHRRHRLQRHPHHIVVGLLRRQRLAGSLGVKAQPVRAGVGRPEPAAHFLRPDAAGRPELGDFLEEVVVHIEEEAEPRREIVHRQPPFQPVPHILEAVGQGKGQLLHGVGAGLADVVAADADGVPARHIAGGELHRVGHQPHGRMGREDVFVLGDVFFQDVVLNGAAQLFQ